MKKWRSGWVAIPLLLSGIAFSAVPEAANAQQRSEGDVRLRVARFWRDGRTLLEGVVGMPVARVNRTVELAVRDHTGKVLHSEATTDSAHAQAAALSAVRAETTEMLELVLGPGDYSLTVVTAEAGRRDSATVPVQAFAATPVISDVVLSAHMRVLGENEEPTAVEMKRGRYAIERGARVTVIPSEPRLWYYLELYRQNNADSIAQLDFRIAPAGRDSALVRVTRNVAVGARGTVDAAALVVQGLPPGDYVLTVDAKAGSREERRQAEFTMGSFETAPGVVAPSAAAGATASEGALYEKYFAPVLRSDAEINLLVEALTIGAPGRQVPAETLQLPTDAQRRYLSRYWARVPDPTPATAAHEMFEEYGERVKYAERQFKERGRAGVRTDRGKIYLKLGAPDVTQQIPVQASKGVEIWKYTRSRSLKFAFMDQTGFHDYVLIYTTDPQERVLPDWQERVGDVQVIRTILNF